MNDFTHTLVTIVGFGAALILVYLLTVRGSAVTEILKATGNFVTSETTALQGR